MSLHHEVVHFQDAIWSKMSLVLLLQFEKKVGWECTEWLVLPLPPPPPHAMALHGNLIRPGHFIPQCAETLIRLRILEALLANRIL